MTQSIAVSRPRRARVITRALQLASLVVGLGAAPPGASAETFDLHLRPYCAPGTYCGHATQMALNQFACQAVEEVNLIWEPTGISFRPTVFAADSTSPADSSNLPDGFDKYYQIPGCAEGDDNTLARQAWRDDVAKANKSAITMLLVGMQNRCCSGIPRTNKPTEDQFGIYCDIAPTRTFLEEGSLWAHEIGHHWSLSHTHGTCADSADGENESADADAGVSKLCSSLNADGESEKCGNDQDCANLGLGTCKTDQLGQVSDTPADACKFEKCKKVCSGDTDVKCTTDADCNTAGGSCECAAGADEDFDGALIDGHTWFASKDSERDITGIPDFIDTGSPHPTWCDVERKTRDDGATTGSDSNPSGEVTVRDVMSYHGVACRGPQVRNGVRREAFTADQLARIAQARIQIAPRDAAHLPDVCASRGGDSDHDGICQQDDNCKTVRNTCQADTDGDGDGDACDLCPGNPNSTGDMDGDGIGDICDDDLDGDGCLNTEDQHPNNGLMKLEHHVHVGCPSENEDSMISEGADPDDDGIPSCKDPDDDDDGICDDAAVPPGATCTAGPDACPETADPICIDVSATDCQPDWMVCLGGDCVENILKISQVVNPDPTRDLVFERFWIVNREIYVRPLSGRTASESIVAIEDLAAGQVGGGFAAAKVAPGGDALGAGAAGEGRVRLEIWSRGGALAPSRLLATVGEFDASSLAVRERGRGGLARLVPQSSRTGSSLVIESVFAIAAPGEDVADTDADGTPDLLDDCVGTPNLPGRDADRDGFGDRCDADLDGDGSVTPADLARIDACQGAFAGIDLSMSEPARFDGEDLSSVDTAPDRLTAALGGACRGADLDGDGSVTPADARLAAAMLGRHPGPSAVVRGLPQASANLTQVCSADGSVRRPRLDLGAMAMASESRSLRLSGELVLPAIFGVPPAPDRHGVALLVRAADGTKLFDAVVPAGAYDPVGRTGWRVSANGKSARWRGDGAVAQGVDRVSLRRLVRRGETIVKFDVRARHGQAAGVGAPLLPLRGEIGLEPRPAASRWCGATDFLAAPAEPACERGQGGAVSCK